ncbi:ATP-dependent Clp protease ATP-binding subunit, partial [bacterium]|nr:ATP-dependent Clp protease ATP-binding subunit [bacterium]
NILLQVLEDGRLTDNNGRTIDFKNTVVIMTSNIGARLIDKGGALGFQPSSGEMAHRDMRSKVMSEVKKVFNPEFLNRVDEVIVFHNLEKNHLEKIVDLLLSKVNVRLEEKKVKLMLSPEAKELLIEKGYSPQMGARPLKRTVQRLLEDPLAEKILRGELKPDNEIYAHRRGDKIQFEIKVEV